MNEMTRLPRKEIQKRAWCRSNNESRFPNYAIIDASLTRELHN